MKKIIFGITSLGIGGAERVLVDIANKLKDDYDITIFTLYRGGAFEKELDKKIKLRSLYNYNFESMNSLKKIIIPIYVLLCGKHIFNKYIKNGNYDTEVAFLEGPITRIFHYEDKSKKIVWIHNDIRKVFGNNIKSILKGKIDKKIYKKFDDIVFVSEDNKNAFNEMYPDFKKSNKKQLIIYNYIDKVRILKKAEETNVPNIDKKNNTEEIDKTKTSIVTVARLVKQKAIDRLARVHKRLLSEGLEHNIYVIGDGPERKKIEELVQKLKIQGTFKLLGKKENPYPYIKNADYFALLTYFEGYPMAVEEAKILNKKIIITNTAAKEVVKDYNKKKIIENDEEAIVTGIREILKKGMNIENENTEYDNSHLIDVIKNIL